jgi:hypothetical protein
MPWRQEIVVRAPLDRGGEGGSAPGDAVQMTWDAAQSRLFTA